MSFRYIIFPVIAALVLSSCANRAMTSVALAPSDMPETAPAKKPSWTQSTASFFGNLAPSSKKRPQLATLPNATGKVRSVNFEHSFALIENASSNSLQPGTELYTTANHQETATLRVTPLRNGTFIVADITEGRPSQGDAVHVR